MGQKANEKQDSDVNDNWQGQRKEQRVINDYIQYDQHTIKK